MAFFQESLSLSRETPRIVKFFVLNSLNAFTTFGFSILQGPHQLAQKSISTNFPLKELMETSFPFTSCITSSGTVLPIHESLDGCSGCCCWLAFSISDINAFPGKRDFKFLSALSISEGGRLLEAQPSARTPRVAFGVVRMNCLK